MTYWADVPVTICSVIEGWHIEALLRRNPDITMTDFLHRMLDSTPQASKGKSTTLTNRTMRFRDRSWNTAWRAHKASSDAHLEWLKSALPEECVKANSTKRLYRDLTEEEHKELEDFPKKTEAEKAAILAQRKKASAALLRPRTGMASSSVLSPTANGSATNHRKRQRRDSIQSATDEDFNQALLKRRKLQIGLSARRDDEQVLSHCNQPSQRRRRQHNHNSQVHRVHHGDNGLNHKEEGFNPSNTPNTGHHQGPTIGQSMLSHTQQQNGRITYDDYHLDPELDQMDDAEDAPSTLWEPGNAAFDQRQEQINLEAAQPRVRADDIEYMNDIQNAPAGFWDAVDPAAHQGQVEHVSLSDDQRRILNTLASVQLEVGKSYIVICLDDRKAVKGLIDASSITMFDQLSMEAALREIAQLAVEPNRKTVSQEARDKQRVANVKQHSRSAYLPVDKDHIVVCIDSQPKAYRGVTAAEGKTLWNEVTLEYTIETLGNLLTRPGVFGQDPPLSKADRTGLTQQGETASIVDSNQRPENIWIELDTSSVQEESADPMTGSGGTHPGILQEFENAPSPLRQRASVGSSKSPRAASPAAETAYAGSVVTTNPCQQTQREQAIADDAEASLDRALDKAWDEWTGDGHYLASVKRRAALNRQDPPPVIEPPAVKPSVEGSSEKWNGLASEIGQSPLSRPGSPTSSDSSLLDKLPDVEDPAYHEFIRKHFHRPRYGRFPEDELMDLDFPLDDLEPFRQWLAELRRDGLVGPCLDGVSI